MFPGIFQHWKDDSWKGPAACLLSCGRAAVLCRVRPVKPRKNTTQKQSKKASVILFSLSGWSRWREKVSWESRVAGLMVFLIKESLTERVRKIEGERWDERWCCIRVCTVSCCQIWWYICLTLCWGDGFIFMACLSAQDIYRLTW